MIVEFRDDVLNSNSTTIPFSIITLHAQRERGKVMGLGVLVYICLWSKKIFESYFSDRLTFSNIHGRTSLRIYRLVLALLSLETLSSLSK